VAAEGDRAEELAGGSLSVSEGDQGLVVVCESHKRDASVCGLGNRLGA
jgi:hypothetical protein